MNSESLRWLSKSAAQSIAGLIGLSMAGVALTSPGMEQPASISKPSPTLATPFKPTSTTTSRPITPHGLYQIGGDPWTNPNMKGDCAALYWKQIDKPQGMDWRQVDAKIEAAASHGKQIRFAVLTLNSAPADIIAAAKVYTSAKYGDQFILPWDPAVQQRLLAFLKAVCQHVDGKVAYLTLSGVGVRVESYMPMPSEIGWTGTLADLEAAWINSTKKIEDTYAANLTKTAFMIAAGTPFKDQAKTGEQALLSVLNYGLKYPLFGAMQWGLNANSATPKKNGRIFYINQWIKDNDVHPTGFQMTGASDGSVGGNLKGTLEQCFRAGDALGADIIEVYRADAANPEYAPLLKTYNDKLK